MGRRDAVQVTLEVIARMRQMEPRLIVSYEPGWETRGNGTSANYEGGIVHHTATPTSLARPFPTQSLLRIGRTGLPGPLCNEAGPACTVEQPHIHVMSANPANHAGASGGRSMGPLPVTSLFNPRVRGLEIDYAGTVPMLAGQLYVAHLWARANADVVGGGDINRIRAHMETSVTGKFDIGYAPGRTYDMAEFRRDAAAILAKPAILPVNLLELNMERIRTPDGTVWAVTDFTVDAITDQVESGALQKVSGDIIDLDWAQKDAYTRRAQRNAQLFQQGVWLQSPPEGGTTFPIHRLAGIDDKTARIEDLLADDSGAGSVPISIAVGDLTEAFAHPKVAAAIGEALAAAQDRRARDGDPATGPVS